MSENDSRSATSADNAGVRIPPPLIFLGGISLGAFIEPWIPDWLEGLHARLPGIAVAVSGLAIMLVCAAEFRKAKTDIKPWKPASAIIDRGLYRFSRNPIYFGMAIIHLGIGTAVPSVAILLMLIPTVIVIRVYVIAREERYLKRAFGQPYLDYMSRVRRWL